MGARMRGFFFGSGPSPRKVPKAPSREDPVRDPVCGMALNLRYVEHFTEWRGVRYGFCSLSCKLLFDQDPDYYRRFGGAGIGPSASDLEKDRRGDE